MLCSSKAYEELNQLFWKDYSEYEKDNENGKTEI
jgi:hypothetical protein